MISPETLENLIQSIPDTNQIFHKIQGLLSFEIIFVQPF